MEVSHVLDYEVMPFDVTYIPVYLLEGTSTRPDNCVSFLRNCDLVSSCIVLLTALHSRISWDCMYPVSKWSTLCHSYDLELNKGSLCNSLHLFALLQNVILFGKSFVGSYVGAEAGL